MCLTRQAIASVTPAPVLADVHIAPIKLWSSEKFWKYSGVINSSTSWPDSMSSSTRSTLFRQSNIGIPSSLSSPSSWFLSYVDCYLFARTCSDTYLFQFAVFSMLSWSVISPTTRAPDAPLQKSLLMPPTTLSCPYKSQSCNRISLPSISSILMEKSHAMVARYSSSNLLATNLLII